MANIIDPLFYKAVLFRPSTSERPHVEVLSDDVVNDVGP